MLRMKPMKTNDLGKTFLVEECQKISFSKYLSRAKLKLKEALLSSELSIFDVPIGLTTSHTGFGGLRYWFSCPNCSLRVGTLFKHPLQDVIGCRKCLNIEYRKRRYKGMIEANFD